VAFALGLHCVPSTRSIDRTPPRLSRTMSVYVQSWNLEGAG
jgi:hypothetical protein